MKITTQGREPQFTLGSITIGSGTGGSGQVLTSAGSNGSVSWASNVALVTANGSNALLGPSVNIAAGTGVSLAVSSNTVTITSTATGGGVTDHGDLSGLSDDDHPQYSTEAEVIALIAANAPTGGEPLTNGNDTTPEIVFAGGDVIMVGSTSGSGSSSSSFDFVDARDYGVVLDCRGAYDAVVTGGALSTVTSATAAFVSADTGKTYTLASTAGAVTTGTLTYVNATTCTMSTAAGGAMTGARLIFGTDDTEAWQDALDAALPGQTVDASGFSWRSLCTGQLSIAVYKRLGFEGRGPFEPNDNPAMVTAGPTFVVVQDASTPFITMNRGSGLGDFIFYSANQVPPTASTATAFAPFVKTVQGGCRIGSPYFANAYDGMWIWSGRHHIGRPQIGAFANGIWIDHSEDVVDIDRITCHPYWRIAEGQAYTPTASSLDEYAQDNGRALRIGRADAFKVGSIFTFGLYGALLAIDSPDSQSPDSGYGMVGMIDADNCVVGIDAWETNTPGILIGSALLGSNGSGVGTAGSAGIATHAGGSLTPKLVLKSWSHRGTWSTAASSAGAGTTLIVPGTNPG